jgi:hypothetical protein
MFFFFFFFSTVAVRITLAPFMSADWTFFFLPSSSWFSPLFFLFLAFLLLLSWSYYCYYNFGKIGKRKKKKKKKICFTVRRPPAAVTLGVVLLLII